MKALNYLLAIAMVGGASVASAVTLPDIIGDNMVLQQSCEAKLWGWSDADVVKVTVSWSGITYEAATDDEGRWNVAVATPAASYDTYSIKFEDGRADQTINGVLAGEVWFCSGQSNMEMPLNGFGHNLLKMAIAT